MYKHKLEAMYYRLLLTKYLVLTIVIFKQSYQLAICANLVFDFTHIRSKVRIVAAVGVAQHSPLQKVLLLRIFFESHEKFAGIGFFRENDVAQSLKNENRSQLIIQ
jgi:hypothetical protein